MHNPFRQSDLNINSFGQNITIAGKLADKQTGKWVFIPTQTFHCNVHYMILSVTLKFTRVETTNTFKQAAKRTALPPPPQPQPAFQGEAQTAGVTGHTGQLGGMFHISVRYISHVLGKCLEEKENCHSQSRKIKILHYQLRQLAACGASSSYWCNSCRQSPPR